MKRHQYVGMFLVVVGAAIIVRSFSHGPLLYTRTPQPPGSGLPEQSDAQAVVLLSTTPPDGPASSHIDYLVNRALREADVAALRAATSIRRELLTPLERNDRSFAEKLYTLGANARALSFDEESYREYVAARYEKELWPVIAQTQSDLEAVVYEYLFTLDRIAQATALESGLDVEALPEVSFDGTQYTNMLRAELRHYVDRTASVMRSESRQGAAYQLTSFGLGLVMPTPLPVDLAIGAALDGVVEGFRDPVGAVAIEAHLGAEKFADRVCFGSEERPDGVRVALFEIARFQNAHLRTVLTDARQTPRQMFWRDGGECVTDLVLRRITERELGHGVEAAPAIQVGKVHGEVKAKAEDKKWWGELSISVKAKYTATFGWPYSLLEKGLRVETNPGAECLVVFVSEPEVLSAAVDTRSVFIEERQKDWPRTWKSVPELQVEAHRWLTGEATADARKLCGNPDSIETARAVARDFVLDMIGEIYAPTMKRELASRTMVVFPGELNVPESLQHAKPTHLSATGLDGMDE